MKRQDVPWIAAIWAVAFVLSALLAASADEDQVVAAGVLTAINGSMATGLYVWARRNVHDRRDVLWIAGIWALLLGATIVLGAAFGNWHNAGLVTGFVGFFVTGWYLDRRRRERKAIEKAQRKLRPCPKCGEYMPREDERCPGCHARSTPWIRQGGLWWTQDEDGAWQRWNEAGQRFEPHRGPGAPATDHGVEPAVTAQDAKL
jgi:hypothetical protein